MPGADKSAALELVHIATIATDELIRLTQCDHHTDLHAELKLVQLHLHEARRLAEQSNP
jgi:hypothetical protein